MRRVDRHRTLDIVTATGQRISITVNRRDAVLTIEAPADMEFYPMGHRYDGPISECETCGARLELKHTVKDGKSYCVGCGP